MEEDFGDRLAKILKKKHMSQKELANRCGITDSAVCRYVNGGRVPHVKTAVKMATVLDVSGDYLLNGMETIGGEIEIAIEILRRNERYMTVAQKREIVCLLFPDE